MLPLNFTFIEITGGDVATTVAYAGGLVKDLLPILLPVIGLMIGFMIYWAVLRIFK